MTTYQARSRVRHAAILASIPIVALTAACASRPPSQTLVGAAAQGTSALTPTPTQAGRGHRQSAVEEASRILTSFAGPPGSVVAADKPAGTPANLDGPSEHEENPNQIDQARWLIVPGAPQAALDWIKAHPPAGSSWSGGGTVGGLQQILIVGYTPTTALNLRQVLVQPGTLPGNRTVIRLDAQVDWLPEKPSGEQIPSTATAVTVVATDTANPTMISKQQATPTTTTDPAKVRRIIAWVNALPTPMPGVRYCPADFGTRVTLTFRTGETGPTLATVTADPNGCGPVGMTLHGVNEPPLAGGGELVQQVDALLGITPCRPLGPACA